MTIERIPGNFHPEFHKLCLGIQIERIKREKDKRMKSLTKITKMIANMINANEKQYEALVEAQDGKSQ